MISALAALWAIAFTLTVFGVSRISPLDRQPAACTLEQVQTCTPPSLSFVHNFWLNTTLPKMLQPYLPLIQPNGIQDLTLIDLGLEVEVQNDAVPLYVRGGMSMGTVFPDDKANLLSKLTYYGVLDGTGDAKEAKRRLRYMMEQPGTHANGGKTKVVSAQGEIRQVSISGDGIPLAQLLFALWLGCLLAVEMTLLFYSAMRLIEQYWCKPDGDVVEEEKSWKEEALTAYGLAFRVILAGAFGTAAASGILVAFWT